MQRIIECESLKARQRFRGNKHSDECEGGRRLFHFPVEKRDFFQRKRLLCHSQDQKLICKTLEDVVIA
jgi:hypothetical protein